VKFLILGGGTQGTAAAFDLLRADGVDSVVIGDLDTNTVHPCLQPHVGDRLGLVEVDASSAGQVTAAMDGVDAVLCGLPYHFNLPVARLAVEAGVHFTDLGGNTAIVGEQRRLDGAARERGISLVPDTGLAPGMVNVFAQAGIDALDSADAVRLWVGGLPQDPRPPLNYEILYSLEGMLDYYVTPAVILRDGKRTQVEALSEVEHLDFPEPIGCLEAFFTGGGTSTLPERYEGRVRTLEYKTLRYPGHAHIMRAIRELGLLSDQEVEHAGSRVNPRKFFIQQVTPCLCGNGTGDLVVVRVEVTGQKDGAEMCVRFEVTDRQDPATGLTAMARTTGFSLSITALMQARGQLRPGAGTPDEVVPAALYIEELRKRGVHTERSEHRTTDPPQAG